MPEMNIAAVRPVDWSPIAEATKEAGIEEPPIYPGSVVDACQSCKIAVYVGPKIQEVISQDPESFTLLCIVCAVRDYQARQLAGYNTEIRDLGNTNTGRPDAKA